MKLLRLVLMGPPVLALIAWGCAAIWFDGPVSRPLAGGLAGAFAIASLGTLAGLRPRRRALLMFGVLFAVVAGWWLSIRPSNDRGWEPSVAQLPRATFQGDLVRIQNLRNFDYRSEQDFDEIWETRSYDLSKLEGADIFLSYWGSPWIAHTIMSWAFEDGSHLAISIETRRESHESYSALLGFFRHYELYYVVSDERDVVRVRTNYRGEDVYLYRLKTTREAARNVLIDYLETINELAEEPRWYNALLHNCTTMIRYHIQNVAPANPWNWRILVNGKLDELGYMRGNIDTSLPFEELRRRSAIAATARAIEDTSEFSRRIREGLPGFEESSDLLGDGADGVAPEAGVSTHADVDLTRVVSCDDRGCLHPDFDRAVGWDIRHQLKALRVVDRDMEAVAERWIHGSDGHTLHIGIVDVE